jgi:hypothetical protein
MTTESDGVFRGGGVLFFRSAFQSGDIRGLPKDFKRVPVADFVCEV